MGTAAKKKDKNDKPKKHKYKHDEKAATGSAADLKKAAKKAAKKASKQQAQQQTEQQARQPPPAAAGGSSSPSSSDEDVVMTQQPVPAAAAAAAAPPAAAAAINLGSSSDEDSDLQGSSDVEVQEAPAVRQNGSSKRPAAAAAAAGGGSKAQAGKSLPEVLQAEGYVQVQAAGEGGCVLDLSGIDDADHKELWVLRLPDGVSVDSLHGRHIHIPGSGLPEATHLRPPPNPFTDPRADLLSHVQAAAPSQEVGHVSLGHDTAQRTGNHRHRELLQSHEYEASTYSIIAAAPPAAAASSSSSSRLKLLKVGRCIQLASDTARVDRTRMGAVSAAGAEVWGSKDGWDGVLLPRRKHRRRLGGWEVQGGSNGSSGSSGRDEEFEEVVFLQPSEEEQQQRQQDRRQQQQRQWVRKGGISSEVLHPRFYSDDEEEEGEGEQQGAAGGGGVQLRQLAGQEEDRALPGGNEAPFMADLQQWVLSLPVDARTAALQQAIAQQYSTSQWAADRRVWWAQPPQNTYLAPSNAAAQAKLLAALESLKDSSSGSRGSESESKSDDGSDDVRMSQPDESAGRDLLNADDIIVMGEGVDGGERDNSDSDEEPGEAAAAAAAAGGVKVPGYPCALPLAYLLTLPQQVEQALSAVRGVRRRQRLRNAAVLLFTDWREVWTQVDNSLLTDDELWQLVCALPSSLRQFIAADPDAERVRRLTARKASAKTLGQQMVVVPPGPRPQYTATDAGYAPYQAAGEKKVAAAADSAADTTDAEDAAIADWLIQQGAGRRAKLLGASELRGRGLDWDTDPGALAREGLHVLLPDGRDVHIPAGTDLDWQGELRRAWGF